MVNSIVEIRALLKFKRGRQTEVKGIGVIIGSEFILTCAHILLYKWNNYDERKEACEAKVYITGKGWIKICQ